MSRRTHLLVLAFLAMVSVSGCTSTTIQTGSGVAIEEFTPGFSEVYPGEPMIFFLKFKNLGSVEAMDVHAEVLGLDEDWAESSRGFASTILDGEVLPEEPGCQYTESGFALKPPDMLYGTEGESGTCTWKYKAPEIPAGMKPTYEVTARVFYNYRTDLVKSFTLASTDELLKTSQQGRSIPASTVSSTRSPVAITAESVDPIRFWEGEITFPLKITISNSGGGMACLEDKCKKGSGSEWNKIRLFIEPLSDSLSVECSGYDKGGVIDVWTNMDNTIVCDIRATGLSQIIGYEERMLKISAEYGYFTDAKASVTIL